MAIANGNPAIAGMVVLGAESEQVAPEPFIERYRKFIERYRKRKRGWDRDSRNAVGRFSLSYTTSSFSSRRTK
jgi:hypothetical protein